MIPSPNPGPQINIADKIEEGQESVFNPFKPVEPSFKNKMSTHLGFKLVLPIIASMLMVPPLLMPSFMLSIIASMLIVSSSRMPSLVLGDAIRIA